MELSKDLVGRMVAIQFARPLMMFEYGAHVKVGDREHLLGAPIVAPGPGGTGDPHAVMSTADFVMGATIEDVYPGWVKFSMLDIRSDDAKVANRVEHTVPSGLVMQIVEVTGFEVPTPSVIPKTRQPQSKLIL